MLVWISTRNRSPSRMLGRIAAWNRSASGRSERDPAMLTRWFASCSPRGRNSSSLTKRVLAPVVEALLALRGVRFSIAVMAIAELGNLTCFEKPRRLMAFLGLHPSEYSTDERRRLGGITKTGNTPARRALVEGAWAYRFPALVRNSAAFVDRRYFARREGQYSFPALAIISLRMMKTLIFSNTVRDPLMGFFQNLQAAVGKCQSEHRLQGAGSPIFGA
jgi:hypothetical protein